MVLNSETPISTGHQADYLYVNGRLRSPTIETVVAQEYDGQGFLMTADAAALGNLAVIAPRLVELAAAQLTRCLVHFVQVIAANHTDFSF